MTSVTPVYAVAYDFGAAELDSVYTSKRRAHERREQFGDAWTVIQAPFYEDEVKDSTASPNVVVSSGPEAVTIIFDDNATLSRSEFIHPSVFVSYDVHDCVYMIVSVGAMAEVTQRVYQEWVKQEPHSPSRFLWSLRVELQRRDASLGWRRDEVDEPASLVMTEAELHDLAVDLIDIVEMGHAYSVKVEFVKREIRARLWTKEQAPPTAQEKMKWFVPLPSPSHSWLMALSTVAETIGASDRRTGFTDEQLRIFSAAAYTPRNS